MVLKRQLSSLITLKTQHVLIQYVNAAQKAKAAVCLSALQLEYHILHNDIHNKQICESLIDFNFVEWSSMSIAIKCLV